jgi:mRNA interferase RelE/StbE
LRALDIKRDALSALDRLDAKQFRQIMLRILELPKEPLPHDSKRLSGYPYFRVSAGEYRIIYAFDDAIVSILMVGKRNDDDIYKRLARK